MIPAQILDNTPQNTIVAWNAGGAQRQWPVIAYKTKGGKWRTNKNSYYRTDYKTSDEIHDKPGIRILELG